MNEVARKKIHSQSRYLNTASLSSCNEFPNVFHQSKCIDLFNAFLVHKLDGLSVFYASNATNALWDFLGCYNKKSFMELIHEKSVLHPVIHARASAENQQIISGRFKISVLIHWVSGELQSDILIADLDDSINVRQVIDASQAVGILRLDEIETLLDLGRRGAIIVGCLQKWIGCPIPLGFALLPTRMLDDDPGLRDHLAARDYLGHSIQPRHGFTDFPDTYSSALAPIIAPYLARALGQPDKAFLETQATVRTNHLKLQALVAPSPYLEMPKASGETRGMVAAEGTAEDCLRISTTLLEHGFKHTQFREHPGPGRSTLRLSAPTVPMLEEDEMMLGRILRGELGPT